MGAHVFRLPPYTNTDCGPMICLAWYEGYEPSTSLDVQKVDTLITSEANWASSARPAKLPRASEITLTEQKPRQTQAPRRLPAAAPVDVCIYQYTRVASDVWELFAGKGDVPLYQVQISHAAQVAAF